LPESTKKAVINVLTTAWTDYTTMIGGLAATKELFLRLFLPLRQQWCRHQ
jgi:hypothetical protein